MFIYSLSDVNIPPVIQCFMRRVVPNMCKRMPLLCLLIPLVDTI